MIDLKETEREFLLFVPAPDKDRARSIAGYRWNPNRRCWVYPKTPRVYDALLAEFGSELPAVQLPRPATPVDDAAAAEDYRRLAAENESLRREIAALRARANGQYGANNGSRARAAMVDTSLLERRLAERDRELAALRRRLDDAEARAQRFADAAARTRAGGDGGTAAASGDNHQQFIAFFRTLALEAAGRDRAFKDLLGALGSPATFPSAAAEALRERLAERPDMSEVVLALPDLVGAARERGVLSADAAQLAMLVSRLAEGGEAETAGAIWARCFLSLYATALVWAESAKTSN